MRMESRFERDFRKALHKTDFKIKKAFAKRLKLFQENPYHPQLANHSLTGKYKGLRSINITGDWRAVFYEQDSSQGKTIIFLYLGTHSQFYK